jgi:D-xylonolactonase
MTTPRSDDAPTLDVGEPRLLVDLPCETGEGPLWHDGERVLCWLDIPPGRVYRFDPATGANELAYEHGSAIGGMTIQEDGSLLLFGERGQVTHWRDGATRTIVDEIPAERDTRFNDVIADPAGRVYCGTMPGEDSRAALYRLDLDGTMTKLYDDIGQSNGMGFTRDRRSMFLTDTKFRAIYQLAWDETSGELRDRVAIIRTPQDNGAPDGMTVDAEDTIWSARWGGWGLFRYDTTGTLLSTVKMPVKNVSSVTFGGPEYGTAFITTATGGEARSEDIGTLAGSLFSLDLGVQGKPPFRSRIDVS